jgi:hypothetical protein
LASGAQLEIVLDLPEMVIGHEQPEAFGSHVATWKSEEDRPVCRKKKRCSNSDLRNLPIAGTTRAVTMVGRGEERDSVQVGHGFAEEVERLVGKIMRSSLIPRRIRGGPSSSRPFERG